MACALGLFGVSNALAHDYEDGVTEVDHGYYGDVVHFDHHHYYYDECGNPYVVHHDHHYVVPNEDYGYPQSYYQQPYYRQGMMTAVTVRYSGERIGATALPFAFSSAAD